MEVFVTIFTCLFCYFLGMTVGYKIGFLYGKIIHIDFSPKEVDSIKPKRYNTKEPEVKKSIEIDEKKIVIDIKTAGMEKKYESLGKLTKTDEDISNSVNKLKNLRKD
jgi:hypothetical protein